METDEILEIIVNAIKAKKVGLTAVCEDGKVWFEGSHKDCEITIEVQCPKPEPQ